MRMRLDMNQDVEHIGGTRNAEKVSRDNFVRKGLTLNSNQMKKTILMGLSLIACAVLTSCSHSMTESISRHMTPDVAPLIAELDVRSEKVEGTYTVNDKRLLNKAFKLGKRHKDKVEDEVVVNAMFNALNSAKADVLIGMQVQVTKVYGSGGCMKEKTAYVTGYPAYYKNIRPYVASHNKFNIDELKDGVPYIITEVDAEGETHIYQIIYPEKTPQVQVVETGAKLDLNAAQLDKVVLTRSIEPDVTVELATPEKSTSVIKADISKPKKEKATKKATKKAKKSTKKTKKAKK